MKIKNTRDGEEKLYLMDWKLKATSDANKKVQFAFQSNV